MTGQDEPTNKQDAGEPTTVASADLMDLDREEEYSSSLDESSCSTEEDIDLADKVNALIELTQRQRSECISALKMFPRDLNRVCQYLNPVVFFCCLC